MTRAIPRSSRRALMKVPEEGQSQSWTVDELLALRTTELSEANAAREAAEAKVVALTQELEAFRSGTKAPMVADGSDLGATGDDSDTLDELGWHLAFDTIDDNGDGVLSLEEFRSRLAAGFEPGWSRASVQRS
mmetsp:Transcript_72156/g.191762  ORF Transcript_72156/g.191762 Transcript_72156/m.191762 type:complete len:133 (+) Transcript_72156:3-401(+)